MSYWSRSYLVAISLIVPHDSTLLIRVVCHVSHVDGLDTLNIDKQRINLEWKQMVFCIFVCMTTNFMYIFNKSNASQNNAKLKNDLKRLHTPYNPAETNVGEYTALCWRLANIQLLFV